VLPALQTRYPRLIVELRETQTKILIDELVGGNLDGVMLALPVPDPEIETIRLFEGKRPSAATLAEGHAGVRGERMRKSR
jgi:LysR family hydrogen peroxide-inducible transcriptional activator